MLICIVIVTSSMVKFEMEEKEIVVFINYLFGVFFLPGECSILPTLRHQSLY